PVEAFANRLKKNMKPLQKWAKRENVECCRHTDQRPLGIPADRHRTGDNIQHFRAWPTSAVVSYSFSDGWQRLQPDHGSYCPVAVLSAHRQHRIPVSG